MDGVWSDSKTFKLIDLFEHVVYTMYSETITITEQEKRRSLSKLLMCSIYISLSVTMHTAVRMHTAGRMSRVRVRIRVRVNC